MLSGYESPTFASMIRSRMNDIIIEYGEGAEGELVSGPVRAARVFVEVTHCAVFSVQRLNSRRGECFQIQVSAWPVASGGEA